MRRTVLAALLLTGCASSGGAPEPTGEAAAEPPTAKTQAQAATLARTEARPVTETLHGVEVQDPFRWLEDAEADDVKAWMAARDAHARAALAALPERDALVKRYRELLYVEARSAPEEAGGRLFFSVKPADKEKAIYYWQQGEAGVPQVLLDPNALAEDGSMSVHSVVPSPEGSKVAYMEQANNADESTLKVMQVATGQRLAEDTIEHLRYTEPSWTPKGDGFYYTWIPSDPAIAAPDRMAFAEVRFHRLGTDPAKDPTVRAKTGDASTWQGAQLSKDGRFLILTQARGWSEQDVYVMEPGAKKPAWAPLAVGTKSNYQVVAHGGALYVASNHEAPRWRIFRVDPKRLARKDWRLIVPEHATAVLESMTVVGGKLGLSYLDHAANRLELRGLGGELVRQVALPTLGTTSGFAGDPERDVAYFRFSSFNYPEEVYKTSISTGETEVFAKVEVPMDPSRFAVEQVSYPSKDGTLVTMFLVYDKALAAQGHLQRRGDLPVLMFGYGGFNIPLTPSFNALIVPWLERGGVYAMPNLRGGGEYGEAWHQAGMLAHKQNVFDDFIGAARWLQAEGYTTPARTLIYGRSNGGLLVGAAMTQAPELYTGVICGVPLLDMVRYHRFGVGKAWIPEYGSAEDPAQFQWLYAYSPYHRVKAGTAYPALLMLSADTDDRVDPLHARKFVAQVENATAGPEPILLRIEANSGHGGADMRAKYAVQAADMVAFALSQTR